MAGRKKHTPRPRKVHVGSNVRSHAATGIISEKGSGHHESRSAGGHQSIRSRARHALASLPFQSNGRAEKQGGKELNGKMENDCVHKIASQKSTCPRTEKTQAGPRSRL